MASAGGMKQWRPNLQGIWRDPLIPRGEVIPIAYAVFATANLLLFPVYNAMPAPIPMWAYAIYVVGGIGLSWGSLWLLRRAQAKAT